jgi:predicted transcriptional regulator
MKKLIKARKEDAVGAVCLLLRFTCIHDGYVRLWQVKDACNWHQNSSRAYAEILVSAGVFERTDYRDTYKLTSKALRLVRRLNGGSTQRFESLFEDLAGLENSATCGKPRNPDIENKGLINEDPSL